LLVARPGWHLHPFGGVDFRDDAGLASLAEAQQRIEAWRQEYHTERPHRGLGQRTPAEYAACFTPE
jgi:putative transposase